MKISELLIEASGNLNALRDIVQKLAAVSDAEIDGKSLDVQTKKGNSVTFVWRKNTWEATVAGEEDDIDIGDVGSTPAGVIAFIKAFDNKQWFRDNDETASND